MADLRQTFGRMVAAHRRRLGLTQEALAEKAGISVDMISKLETGATGARFQMIEKLAATLQVHPAELFTADVVAGRIRRRPLQELIDRLSELDDQQLAWIKGIVDASLKGKA